MVQNDGLITLSIGKSRKDTNWKSVEWSWSDLLKRLATTTTTPETFKEYIAFSEDLKAERKDIGGFVGGHIAGGNRVKRAVINRSIITLDADSVTDDIWELYKTFYGNAGAIYTTHKHQPRFPRYRLIIPLKTPVTPEKYIPIARRIAGDLGIENFDNTGFQPERLMYWPSTSRDGVYFFDKCDGEWLDPDAVLSTYVDWRDSSQWPLSSKAKKAVEHLILKQGDPLAKKSAVGTFCRAYTIEEAIHKFLPDIYKKADQYENRYTYIKGESSAGLVIYDEKYAYSHHSTDPISETLRNAFDLVRIHKFAIQDLDSPDGTPPTKLPSYQLMLDLMFEDSKVKKQLGSERMNRAKEEFGDLYELIENSYKDTNQDKESGDRENVSVIKFDGAQGEDSDRLQLSFTESGKIDIVDPDWEDKIKYNKLTKDPESTISNMLLVLRNDPLLRNIIALNLFEQCPVALADLPWRKVDKRWNFLRDVDDSGLRHYLESVWHMTGKEKIADAVKLIINENAYHPVKNYLSRLVWDGTPRLDRLLVTYMGAEDTEYVRTVTRKTFVAAVKRIYEPGCKFDYVLSLLSDEGKRKSTLIKVMAKELWFSDSLTSIKNSTKAYEELQGVWLIEVPELSAFKDENPDIVKAFISKPTDRYRVPYEQRTADFPRQCIFIGTSNKLDFLKSRRGNRRFWPVQVALTMPGKDVNNDLTGDVDQIWAEALELYRLGETVYLDERMEAIAFDVQAEHTEQDEREGMVRKYLEMLLPDNWATMSIGERAQYVRDYDDPNSIQVRGTNERMEVSAPEIICELFDGRKEAISTKNTYEVHSIMRNIADWVLYPSKTAKRDRGTYGIVKTYIRKNQVNKHGVVIGNS